MLQKKLSSNISDSSDSEQVHLFVLVHGLWGSPNHMHTIEKCLVKGLSGFSPQRIVTIKPSSFRFWKTYDGILRCAELVIADVFYKIEELKQTSKFKVSHISIIGYSLGGLVSRYVVGCFEKMGFFDEVTPVFFSTFATPHLGARFFKNNLLDRIANACGPFLFGKTGQQLFLNDSEKLLVEMADPSSRFYKGLQRFQRRIAMANIKNDRSVAFYTSFITNYSPFDELDYIDVKYFDDLPTTTVGKAVVSPKFVDLRRCVKLSSLKNHPGNAQEESSIIRSNKVLRYTILIVAACVLVPFFIPLALFISFSISAYSSIKIKLLRTVDLDKLWIKVRDSVYRDNTINSDHALQGEVGRVERLKLRKQESIKKDIPVFTEQESGNVMLTEQNFINDYTHLFEEDENDDEFSRKEDTFDKATGSSGNKSSSRKGFSLGSCLRSAQKIEILCNQNDLAIKALGPKLESYDPSEFPLFSPESKLPENEIREAMVTALDRLSWTKIPVYFDLFNAHDSIVARKSGCKNLRATSTIFLWAAVLRNHIHDQKAP